MLMSKSMHFTKKEFEVAFKTMLVYSVLLIYKITENHVRRDQFPGQKSRS